MGLELAVVAQIVGAVVAVGGTVASQVQAHKGRGGNRTGG